jgi:cAMP-binding proteins - catabolite gene activator and regulatory subunit of cAMP-dependent protein kinases
MFTDRFLANRRGVELTSEERALLESAISEVRTLEPRTTLVRAGEAIEISTLLVEGMMSRYIDDHKGLRQLVAVHVAGEFVDLHAYPMHRLDHSIGTLTGATVAIIPHDSLQVILAGREEFARKLWFSTMLDAALHRAWLFRLGRLDAVGRVAHFLSETNARLQAAGLSDGRRFALGLTQSDIAEVCGLTTVHTNRAIRQLREADLCVFKSSLVEIIDAPALAKRGDFDPHYLYLAPSE